MIEFGNQEIRLRPTVALLALSVSAFGELADVDVDVALIAFGTASSRGGATAAIGIAQMRMASNAS